jgi:CheY-like chemotaxis protein/two-component sensor histidine kinase
MESDTPPPSPAQMVSINQILQAGWFLLDLINEILDLAMIESGRLPLSLEPLALRDVLRECRAMVDPQAHERNIRLTFPDLDGPYFVEADRKRVKQILINLLTNAIKYNNADGTVVVDCSARTPDRIRVTIADSGDGLPPEKLAQLFEPFNRLGQEATAEEGTGIGLVVTKRLVELMGGSIGVESTVGSGCTFWFELGAVAAPDVAPEAEAPKGVQPGVSIRALVGTLLYVEDNPASLELVEQLLSRRANLRLLSAADGDLGIEYARTFHPDVILMDINLPGVGGLDAMKILRADPPTAHIPIIAISANAVPRDIEKALAAGFFRYLTKPIKVNEFMAALDLALALALEKA